jgi:hypothetical protein
MNFINFMRSDENAAVNQPQAGDEANPPRWPSNDKDNAVVFVNETNSPEDVKKYQDVYDSVEQTFRSNEDHFSNKRTAIFFEKGTYYRSATIPKLLALEKRRAASSSTKPTTVSIVPPTTRK